MKKVAIWVFSIVLICVTGIGLYWGYFILHWTDHLVDKNVIAGIKTNNSYGIRNEVYDFLVNEEFIKYNMNQEQKNLLLNEARYDQLLLENFDNVDKILEIFNKKEILWECKELSVWRLNNFGEEFPGENKFKYRKIMGYSTPDHELAYNYYNNVIANNQSKIKRTSSYKDKESEIIELWCSKYKKEVFND